MRTNVNKHDIAIFLNIKNNSNVAGNVDVSATTVPTAQRMIIKKRIKWVFKKQISFLFEFLPDFLGLFNIGFQKLPMEFNFHFIFSKNPEIYPFLLKLKRSDEIFAFFYVFKSLDSKFSCFRVWYRRLEKIIRLSRTNSPKISIDDSAQWQAEILPAFRRLFRFLSVFMFITVVFIITKVYTAVRFCQIYFFFNISSTIFISSKIPI